MKLFRKFYKDAPKHGHLDPLRILGMTQRRIKMNLTGGHNLNHF